MTQQEYLESAQAAYVQALGVEPESPPVGTTLTVWQERINPSLASEVVATDTGVKLATTGKALGLKHFSALSVKDGRRLPSELFWYLHAYGW